MKKFVKIASLVAALGFALFLAGCSNSSDSGSNNANGAGAGTGNGNGQTTEPASCDYKKVDTVTINGTVYDIVVFGLWPQTIKAKSVTVDTNVTEIHGAFTYCKGSDGQWYVKQAEKSWYSNKYSDGTTVGQDGTSEQWFKVEPIKWRVLTTNYGGAKLLLAESILIGGVPYYLNTSSRTIGGKTIYANNYKYSTIRAWLNGSYEHDDTQTKTHFGKGFLQSAFIAAQQAVINTTTVDNSARSTNTDVNAMQWNSGDNQYSCDPTSGEIFLLSEQEVTTKAYGFADYNKCNVDGSGIKSTRIRVTTDFAKATGVYQNTNWAMGGCWRLRSPYYSRDDCVCNVDTTGYAFAHSNGTNDDVGIVPALCVSN